MQFAKETRFVFPLLFSFQEYREALRHVEQSCFSQLNAVKTTKLSRGNLILKNHIFLPRKHQCILVARSCPKVVKKGPNRLENLAFGKFLVNVNCLNNFLKFEISDVFENIEKWVLRRPERSLFESKMLCHES